MANSDQPFVKEFVVKSEVLPFTKYGITTPGELKEAEEETQELEKLKRVGLNDEEIKLYKDHKAGVLESQSKIEKTVLKEKLDDILARINNYEKGDNNSTEPAQPSPGTSVTIKEETAKSPTTIYPAGHPMNAIKQLESTMFSDQKEADSAKLTKRRKILRHLERRQQELEAAERRFFSNDYFEKNNGVSLWDKKKIKCVAKPEAGPSAAPIESKEPNQKYTIKDKKIVRVAPLPEAKANEVYRVIDVVLPINNAETQLLEGSKVCVDDIRKMDRFKDYDPGIPSKVLYLKNIEPSVSQPQLSILFNQFFMDNGGPIEVRLLTGRMRGQAFVRFNHDHVAIQALEEINGTVLVGRPIIAEFGKNSNRLIDDGFLLEGRHVTNPSDAELESSSLMEITTGDLQHFLVDQQVMMLIPQAGHSWWHHGQKSERLPPNLPTK